ncbi:ParB/RepB/Spo0J family partition protein [Nonomuraea sp. KM90]|uniref:ParB/RepB/Spo0J family partition protein n=1 Tax=Nonomuraea sp. KM90 TaxID=3457428 RepID=UPI003FCD4A2C
MSTIKEPHLMADAHLTSADTEESGHGRDRTPVEAAGEHTHALGDDVIIPDDVQYVRIRPQLLTPHERNARENLGLDDDPIVESIRENGITDPLHVLRRADGRLIIGAGERRWTIAIEALKEDPDGPCAFIPALIYNRPELTPQEFIDMIIENQLRKSMTKPEVANALFSAADMGWSPQKIARHLGYQAKDVEHGIAAGRLSAETRRDISGIAVIEQDFVAMATLAEFHTDPAATARIISAAANGYFDHQVSVERRNRERAHQQALARAAVESRGVRVVDDVPAGAVEVHFLHTAAGAALTSDAHAGCPGHIVVLQETDDGAEPVAFCANPPAYGHVDLTPLPVTPDAREQAEAETERERARQEARAANQFVREGNEAWRAAEPVRRTFLAGVIAGKNVPTRIGSFLSWAWVVKPDPVRKWASSYGSTDILNQLLGIAPHGDSGDQGTPQAFASEREELERIIAKTGQKRQPLLQFASVATAYERRMDVRTWRDPDSFNDHWERGEHKQRRAEMAVWLTLLAELGYRLSPIEEAVAHGRLWAPPGDGTPDIDVDASGDDVADSDEVDDSDDQPVDRPIDQAA